MVFAVVTVVPLILTALWRHWRDASPAGRRALLPVVVAFPIEAALAAADALVRAVGFQPGIAFFDGPSGTALRFVVPMILPIGLLITFLRPRLNRGRMAGLVVELGRGVPLGGLRDVLARALGDPSLQLAFAAPSGSGYVDAAGQPVDLPVNDPTRTVTRLERGDELLGVLVHDPLIEVEDPGLVEAVGNAARLALENERLAAEVRAQLEEVRASRVRIVEAADAERRRVERDLHDGAQQRLVALAMRLQVAKQSTPEASALLDAATTELETAIGEVRGLARGVHPTILTESGLAAAIDALAERTTIPVIADVVDGRFDATVEATAYFVVAEALTNVVRYSGAGGARVTVREEGDALLVEVADDGRGGADPAAGSGLRGLDDRVAAIGGRLSVTSPAGGGTTIRAELPVHVSAEIAAPATDGPLTDEPVASGSLAVRAVPAAPAAEERRRVGAVSPLVLILALTGGLAVLARGRRRAREPDATSSTVEPRRSPGRSSSRSRPTARSSSTPSPRTSTSSRRSRPAPGHLDLERRRRRSPTTATGSWTTRRRPGHPAWTGCSPTCVRFRASRWRSWERLTVDGRPAIASTSPWRTGTRDVRTTRASSCGERRG